MKRFVLVMIALVVILVSRSVALAGVVMTQTSVTSGPDRHVTQKRTVYVQGNKQKVKVSGFDTITDLDKGVFYVIDNNKKAYVTYPLASLQPGAPAGGASSSSIQMAKTGMQSPKIISDRGTVAVLLVMTLVYFKIDSRLPNPICGGRRILRLKTL